MIQGYPKNASLYPGDTLTLLVSTDSPQFSIDFYRQGPTLAKAFSAPVFQGVLTANHISGEDWGLDSMTTGILVKGWTPYQIPIDQDVQPGVYIAMFIEYDAAGNINLNQSPALSTDTTYSPSGKALFVIKNPVPGYNSQVLYKLPLFTYHSYNALGDPTYQPGVEPVPRGDGSIYQNVPVTLQRPGGGTGGIPWDGVAGNAYYVFYGYGDWDPFDNYVDDPIQGSPRQVFEHWDAKFISFLEGNGFRVDYCTDMDIHLDGDLALLSNYSLLLSVGHDEYYTADLRTNLEKFRDAGGNIAFFSGNICWWRTEFSDEGLTIMRPQSDPYVDGIHNWFQIGPTYPSRPEDSLTGVSFRNAGGRYSRGAPQDAPAPIQRGYKVQFTGLWPFENSGLKDGDTFGDKLCIVGYECDGTKIEAGSDPKRPAFDPGDLTPPNFRILGIADISDFPDVSGVLPAGQDPGTASSGNATATMGMYSNVGTVFTAATTDWPRVAWNGDPHTVQITKNVMNRLGGNPKGFTNLSNLDNIVSIDGFFSGDDNFRHAIAGSADGTITEIFYNPDEGQGQTEIIQVNPIVDLAGFYTDDDAYRHVVTITGAEDLTEIYYNPVYGVSAAGLGKIPNATRISGFYSDPDHLRHVIVATRENEIYELHYGAGDQATTLLFEGFDDVIDIGSFYSGDDNICHVLVLTADGNVTEVYYTQPDQVSATVIGTVPDGVKISAFFNPNDQFFTRRVQVLGSDGRVHEFRYGINAELVHVILMTLGNATDLGGFYSSDDGVLHSIILFDSVDINELFYDL